MKDGSQSFPPEARLHHGRDYGRVFYRQQKAAGSTVVVLVAPRPKRAARRPRLGIMISAKVAKRAVRRHQLKRWVREFFRTRAQADLGAVDVVVLFRRDPPADGHARLDEELGRLIPKALAATAQPGSGPGSRRQRKGKGMGTGRQRGPRPGPGPAQPRGQ